ncbi:hypothetical protein NRIC_08750 [Enterococcus florum]|uniref:DUF3899 domain-containing protein n=1 Tax=Enterococcus florum TaxID=2480627 RepID=A0A4P5P9I8_9ENTE|nr:hypothetical protein [Enterococcus florum]GCF92984.1 hypothetical protein NRIC_08750 [Enterococcus florum]
MEQVAYVGIMITGVMLLMAILMKQTNGLFWARFPHEFIRDLHDPRFKDERRIGKMYCHFTFTYISPFFLGFLVILIISFVMDHFL